MRDALALVAFLLIVAAAVGIAYAFDRYVLEPALTKAGARILGVTEAEYRKARDDTLKAPWRALRRWLRRRR